MAQRATSLGPCFLFVFFCSLLSLFCFFFNRQKLFPPKKGHFCCSLFSVYLCLFLAFLGPPPFSLSLSWCLSCSFLSSFLSVSHFCILFLLFLFVLLVFFFQAVLLFFFLLVVWFLNHNLRCAFALHLVFLLLLFFVFCCFHILLFF